MMHVKSSMKHWAQDELAQGSSSAALQTWERRLDNQHGKLAVPLLSPAHTGAYLLDPLYCSVRVASPKPRKCTWHTKRQRGSSLSLWQLIERMAGPAACR
jgi:hypothetical protein